MIILGVSKDVGVDSAFLEVYLVVYFTSHQRSYKSPTIRKMQSSPLGGVYPDADIIKI